MIRHPSRSTLFPPPTRSASSGPLPGRTGTATRVGSTSAQASSKGGRVDEPPTTTGEGTRLPGLRGVDHVGITVPDIEQATAFFVDVLGCELLYEREPPRDDSPRDRLGVPPGSRIQAVHFLRCASGANVELFEFYSPDQREDFPRPSDVGIQHLAVYVDDLDRKSTRLNSSHANISYAVFCLKKKK